MRVKRFVGDTVAEAMGKVKIELGPEAVILQTRRVRDGGLLGFFRKSKIEITAAIEEQPVRKEESTPLVNPSYNNVKAAYLSVMEESTKALGKESLEEKSIGQKNPIEPAQFMQNLSSGNTLPIEAEIQSMRQMLERLNRQFEGLEGEQSAWPAPLQKWADHLENRGVNTRNIKKIIRRVQKQVPEEEWINANIVLKCIKDIIREKCQNTGQIIPKGNKPCIIALIGPTGVGKTTTIGKLAANFGIIDRRSVALITVDTYRVAAVDQLKTFGEIMGIPVEVVNTPTELDKVIHNHEDKEIIFIDTAGRSPQHDLHMSELKAFIDRARPDYRMLVMCASTHFMDQMRIYERFKDLTSHIIFTKLDETISGGSILNFVESVDCPIAYITNGQSVPDDIEKASPDTLTRYILGEVNFQ